MIPQTNIAVTPTKNAVSMNQPPSISGSASNVAGGEGGESPADASEALAAVVAFPAVAFADVPFTSEAFATRRRIKLAAPVSQSSYRYMSISPVGFSGHEAEAMKGDRSLHVGPLPESPARDAHRPVVCGCGHRGRNFLLVRTGNTRYSRYVAIVPRNSTEVL